MKKHDLIALNRRREMQRRSKFVTDRLRDMPIELRYAEGKRAELPKRMLVPPAWTLAAARIATEGLTKPIAHLKPAAGKIYQAADLAELIGYYQAIICFVNNPPKGVKDREQDVPELEETRATLSKRTTKGFLKFLRRLKRRGKDKSAAVIPTAAQLSERTARYGKGLDAFATPEGELHGLDLISTRLYYSIWMFWPDLKSRFNAPAIHLWFREALGERVSDKTVEAVVTRLRKEARLVQP